MRKLLFCFVLAVSSMSAAAIVSTKRFATTWWSTVRVQQIVATPPTRYPPPTRSPGQGRFVYSLPPLTPPPFHSAFAFGHL